MGYILSSVREGCARVCQALPIPNLLKPISIPQENSLGFDSSKGPYLRRVAEALDYLYT